MLALTVRNDINGAWVPSGLSELKTTSTNPYGINGRQINGVEVGSVHHF